MKICHVINTLNRGGAETHLFDLVEQQIKEKYIVDLIIIGPDNNNIFSLENEITNLDVPIKRLNGLSLIHI